MYNKYGQAEPPLCTSKGHIKEGEVQGHAFLTSAVDGVAVSGQFQAPTALPTVLNEDEGGWVKEPGWTFRITQKSSSMGKSSHVCLVV
jgi:hypothetical protein